MSTKQSIRFRHLIAYCYPFDNIHYLKLSSHVRMASQANRVMASFVMVFFFFLAKWSFLMVSQVSKLLIYNHGTE